jgi:hypothetical protein
VGEWIPEPVPDPAEWISGRRGGLAADPADRVTLDESVSMAFLIVLDSMTPAERVAFVLHDVFGYSFGELARITGRTPAACRQLASSARRRVRAARPATTPASRQAAVVRAFKAACEAGDFSALLGLLDPGATMVADGGGIVSAARHPIEGAEPIARYITGLASRIPRDLTLMERTVNGEPGLVAQEAGVTVTVFRCKSPPASRNWPCSAGPPVPPASRVFGADWAARYQLPVHPGERRRDVLDKPCSVPLPVGAVDDLPQAVVTEAGTLSH